MRRIGAIASVLAAGAFIPSTALAVASAELYRTEAYTYGRFAARIRYAAGDGVVSSFFLWKEGSEGANAYWNELDFEKIGADCHMQINAIYGNPEQQHPQTGQMPGDICTGYHDYQFEWTPTYIAWAVDGKEIRRETGDMATAFSQNASGGMTFHFNIWPGDASFGGNFSASILPVRQYISWVEYSSYTNGSFKFAWREDFDGGSLPSGWATGTWESPKGLSTHKSANVAFVNGIAILSLTADNATGSPGTPPADSAAGGANSGAAGSGGATSAVTQNRGGTSSGGGTSVATGGTAVSAGGTSTVTTTKTNSGGATTTSTAAPAGGAATTQTSQATSQGGTSSAATTAIGGSSSSSRSTASSSPSPGSGGSSANSSGAKTSTTSLGQGGGTTVTESGGASSDSVRSSAPDTANGGVAASSTRASSATPTAVQGASAPAADSGCGCRVLGPTNRSPSLALFGLMAALWAFRGRHLSARRAV